MKLCVKRIYCAKCKRLVRGLEQLVDGDLRVVCSRCGNLIWVHNGITWKYVPR